MLHDMISFSPMMLGVLTGYLLPNSVISYPLIYKMIRKHNTNLNKYGL